MSATFVFLQVGALPEVPMMVGSIRRLMPDAHIIQCSDANTPKTPGVDRLHVCSGDVKNLMTLRLQAFSELNLQEPAVYLDTDMLLLRPVDPDTLLGEADVAVCERSFDRNAPFNASFGGMDLSCYAGKTVAEVYPYVACFTVTKHAAFWTQAWEALKAMPVMFHFWYGDQEAIKHLVASGAFRVAMLAESVYGCLPEMVQKVNAKPRVLHFKGASRKALMAPHYQQLLKG